MRNSPSTGFVRTHRAPADRRKPSWPAPVTYEQTGELDVLGRAVTHVSGADTGQCTVADCFLDDGAKAHFDLRMVEHLLDMRRLRRERLASMQDDHTCGVLR